MKNSSKNGRSANNSNGSATSDTTTGVTALAVVQAEREKEEVNPIAERLRRINEAGKLTQRRKTLVDASDRVKQFEEGLNGEGDLITLINDDGAELEVQKPDAVRELVQVLKSNVSKSLAQVDEELLSVHF